MMDPAASVTDNDNGDHPEYIRLISEARGEGLSDLESCGCVCSGSDGEGRPVLVLAPKLGLVTGQRMNAQLRRIAQLFVREADRLVSGPYSLVYCHTHLSVLSQQSVVYEFYKILPRKYKKNLSKLYIVHPTMMIRLFFDVGVRWFISEKFYRKLTFVNSIASLQSYIPPVRTKLPPSLLHMEDSAMGVVAAPFMPPLSQSFDPTLGTTRMIHKCVTYLRETGSVRSQGLFRLAGDQMQENLVKVRLYGANYDPDAEATVCIGLQESAPGYSKDQKMSTVVVTDPDTVSSLLKMFLRDLPEPLITYAVYADVMSAGRESRSEDTLMQILNRMPQEHVSTLEHLIGFLSEIAAESLENNMDADNLSRIFSPTLFRSPVLSENTMEVFADIGVQTAVLKTLITNRMKKSGGLELSGLKLSEKMSDRLRDGVRPTGERHFEHRDLGVNDEPAGENR
mmetsp:Transcript_5552/g.8449  ORF Transcript_5552/g.8449 Transcript_5552/m.8449 type:complete len:453 (+) Transcript_5552:9-1367(+)